MSSVPLFNWWVNFIKRQVVVANSEDEFELYSRTYYFKFAIIKKTTENLKLHWKVDKIALEEIDVNQLIMKDGKFIKGGMFCVGGILDKIALDLSKNEPMKMIIYYQLRDIVLDQALES